jgi:hypothetical protein
MTGARGWAYENEVNPVEKIGRRLRPRTPRTRHEEDATQIDPEFGHSNDPGVIHAHDGGPVTIRAGFTQETEGKAESTEPDGRLHHHRRSTTQGTVGHESPPGVTEGDGTGLRQ